jgi:hypothetical protein
VATHISELQFDTFVIGSCRRSRHPLKEFLWNLDCWFGLRFVGRNATTITATAWEAVCIFTCIASVTGGSRFGTNLGHCRHYNVTGWRSGRMTRVSVQWDASGTRRWVSNGVLLSAISSVNHLSLLTVFCGYRFHPVLLAYSNIAHTYWLQIAFGLLVFKINFGCFHLLLTNWMCVMRSQNIVPCSI